MVIDVMLMVIIINLWLSHHTETQRVSESKVHSPAAPAAAWPSSWQSPPPEHIGGS